MLPLERTLDSTLNSYNYIAPRNRENNLINQRRERLINEAKFDAADLNVAIMR